MNSRSKIWKILYSKIKNKKSKVLLDVLEIWLSFIAALNTAFDEIPTWMPPSPPNSVEGACYSPIDGAYLYESTRIPEEKLPPLPSLISLNEVPPRIRQRKSMISGGTMPSSRLSPTQKKQIKGKKTNWPREGGGKLAGQRPMEPKFRHQKEAGENAAPSPLASSSAPNLELLSPPNTPMPAAASTMPSGSILQESRQQIASSGEIRQLNGGEQRGPVMGVAIPPQKAATLSSLDEAIESTVRKSRKQIGHPPPISRYLTRYLGPIPSNGSERLGTDQSRVIFRVILADPRLGSNLPLPAPHSEPIDYEGPPWTANEDFLLLKAITMRHGLVTANPASQMPGIQMNWEFVSQYLGQHSPHYRSPRQCALRYQNHALRCDDHPPEKAPSRRHRAPPMVPPQCVIFDTNFCVQEAVSSVKKRASFVAEIGRRRPIDLPGSSSSSSGHPHSHQTPQLLCMSGRIPHSHEQRLVELGTRHSNVARPMDILMRAKRRGKGGGEKEKNGGLSNASSSMMGRK